MQNEMLKELRRLISSGFDDLEIISFELGIPIEQLKELKREIYISKSRQNSNDGSSLLEIRKMRTKYDNLFSSRKYFSRDDAENKGVTKQEYTLINSVINQIGERTENFSELSQRDIINELSKMKREVNKIRNFSWSVEQASRMDEIIGFEQIQGKRSAEIKKMVSELGKIVGSKLLTAIRVKIEQITSTKDLDKFSLEIGKKGFMKNSKYKEAILSDIQRKRTSLVQKEAIARIRNDIPTAVRSVINGIASGNIDIEEAKETIEQEVERRKQSKKSSNKFLLTSEQERGQIYTQIKMALMEQAEQFPISDSRLAMSKIQELCGGTPDSILKIVIKNLIARNEFKEAKDIFNEFYKTREGKSVISKDILPLRNEIRNAEIGFMVLKVINMRGTEEEERECWELIRRGINTGNVRLSSISLGTSDDGQRKITLEDVWPDEDEVVRQKANGR